MKNLHHNQKTRHFIKTFYNKAILPVKSKLKSYLERHKRLSYRERKDRERKFLISFLSFAIFALCLYLLPVLIGFFNEIHANYPKTINALFDWLSGINLELHTFLGKSYWEWTELLIIPVVFGSGGLLFRHVLAGQERERKYTEILNAYFGRIAELMLDATWPLKESNVTKDSLPISSSTEVLRISAIVQAFTVVTFRSLDPNRQQLLLRFLIESNAIQLIDLRALNLCGADLSGANLIDKCLDGTDLSDANLIDINARGASFVKADMLRCKLDNAKLIEANLAGAYLGGAELIDSNLSESDLSDIDFEGAVFVNANLSKTNLTNANFHGTYFENVNFSEAILEDVVWAEDCFPDRSEVNINGAIAVPEYIRIKLGDSNSKNN